MTLTGMLLFGRTPNRFLPHAGISAMAFSGIEKDYAARERARLRGPMTPLFNMDEETGKSTFVENGLVEQAVDFIKRNTPVTATLEDGARRVDVFAYPEGVLRETIVNALILATISCPERILSWLFFEDRLEVISPGQLPNGITPDHMRTGCRAARNQLLRDALWDYRYLEDSGMGVPRKIIRGMRESIMERSLS